MEAIVKGVVADVVNKKLNGAFSELNGAASGFKTKTKFKWDGLNVLSSNKKNYGVYLKNINFAADVRTAGKLVCTLKQTMIYHTKINW